ncbi:ECA oligosaccharide polymerase [Glaesserella sp.]|uniref:ECA oligosaccharide polymerase n=1 Tax=Glaesserella sp. TaxID=2094731 RepID=UPI0035A1246C
MAEYFLLSGCYLLSFGIILKLMYRDYVQQGLSFHLLFSAVYVMTFFFGFPFSMVMVWGFGYQAEDVATLTTTILTALSAYLMYYASYHGVALWRRWSFCRCRIEVRSFAKKEAELTACMLLLIVLTTMGAFLYLNEGFLLFKLEKYHQIFSPIVDAVALKRFFYFFIPALLIFFFLKPSRKTWWIFLIIGLGLGMLSYLSVGGTRANIAFAFALFCFIGLDKKYLSIKWVLFGGLSAVIVMFLLALIRYKLNVSGSEALFTFLYMSRDTFSPWENVATILNSPIEFQGLMPIIRDFYVFIPREIWGERPDIVWNSANYFTKEILGNTSGLAISPTLLGSFYIMGGFPMIVAGMVVIGGIVNLFDKLFNYAKAHDNQGVSALIQAYCWGNIFNFAVLVREGADSFVSRFVFYTVICLCCWGTARMIIRFYTEKNEI